MHLNANQFIWTLTLAFTFYAGWLDGWTRRIPNWLTLSGILLGVGMHAALGGRRGAILSLEGAGLALAILLPPVLLRLIGAGDWKLMGAVGAFLGPMLLPFVLLASIFAGGAMAMVQMIRAGRVRKTFHNLRILSRDLFQLRWRVHPEISIDNPDLLKLPFGVAAAIGVLLCFMAARWGV